MKKFFALLLCISSLTVLAACSLISGAPGATPTPQPTATPEVPATPTPSPAPTATPAPPPAVEVEVTLSTNNGAAVYPVQDRYNASGVTYPRGTVLHIEAETPFAALNFRWNRTPAVYTVETEGFTVTGGEYGMLHEYLRLPEAVTAADIVFTGDSPLYELQAFSEGSDPEGVQVWQPPCEKADVLVFSAHSDDDVIFFGSLIADCVDRGLAVQVCYLVNHALPGGVQFADRNHELLNALWELGVRNYPLVGPFPDYYILSWWEASCSFGEENVTGYMVELLRRFKPSVAVTHDRNGEYGHGAHMLCATSMEEAASVAGDETQFPQSAELFGTWELPKLYLHLAEENQIVLNVQAPLDSFGGRTAFDVANDAMQYHVSQLELSHRPRIDNEKYPGYDCRLFGLVRSTVGNDSTNDIMENIP